MDPAFARATSTPAADVQDGLGDRFLFLDTTGTETLEMLCLRQELTSVAAFEFAVRERVGRLANFRHAYYSRVRRVDRLAEPGGGLAIVSEHTPGARLSEILEVAERKRLELDINAALCLIRQLVPAIAMLHQNARDVAHGALAPERIVVTPHARLVIVEYVLGSALEQLHYSRERLWKEFRIAMPASAGLPRFDHRGDVTQIGIVALSLVLGRLIRADEYPHRLPELLAGASETSVLGGREPLSAPLRQWLARTLQIEPRYSFHSALEAQMALDEVLSEESGYIAAPIALETFLARYQECAADVQAGARAETARPEVAAIVTESLKPPAAEGVFDKWEKKDTFEKQEAERRLSSAFSHTAPSATETSKRPAAGDVLGTRDVERAPLVPPAPAKATSGFGGIQGSPVADRGPSAPPVRPHPIERATSKPADPSVPAVPARAPAFTPEPPRAERSAKAAAPQDTWRRMLRMGFIVLAIVAFAEGAFIAFRYFTGSSPIAAGTMGTLVVESRPSGADVLVDGKARGKTPATISLNPGAHVLELRSIGEPRVIPLTITAGTQVSQYIELQAAQSTGHLQVRTEPAGASVTVDGERRGVAPLTVPDLAVGEHDILLESDLGSVRQTVAIEPGATASLVVPLSTPNAPLSGWVAVTAPVEMQLFEGGRLLGTSQSDRIMVSAGRHDIELVNETLGYRSTRVVQVPAGKVAPLKIQLPRGTVHLNAVPWAEVWIDGEKIGETPLGNLSVAIGPHEIVFRHPQFGEQRHAATITLTSPTRLSVDLRK